MKNRTVIATNRFGLGARPGDLDTVDRNPQSWLLDQLQGPSRLPADIKNLPHSSHVLVDVEKLRKEKNQRKRSASDEPPPEMARMSSNPRIAGLVVTNGIQCAIEIIN